MVYIYIYLLYKLSETEEITNISSKKCKYQNMSMSQY